MDLLQRLVVLGALGQTAVEDEKDVVAVVVELRTLSELLGVLQGQRVKAEDLPELWSSSWLGAARSSQKNSSFSRCPRTSSSSIRVRHGTTTLKSPCLWSWLTASAFPTGIRLLIRCRDPESCAARRRATPQLRSARGRDQDNAASERSVESGARLRAGGRGHRFSPVRIGAGGKAVLPGRSQRRCPAPVGLGHDRAAGAVAPETAWVESSRAAAGGLVRDSCWRA